MSEWEDTVWVVASPYDQGPKVYLTQEEALQSVAGNHAHFLRGAYVSTLEADSAVEDLQTRLDEAEKKVFILDGKWCAHNRAEGRSPCRQCAWCYQTLRVELEALKARVTDPTKPKQWVVRGPAGTRLFSEEDAAELYLAFLGVTRKNSAPYSLSHEAVCEEPDPVYEGRKCQAEDGHVSNHGWREGPHKHYWSHWKPGVGG